MLARCGGKNFVIFVIRADHALFEVIFDPVPAVPDRPRHRVDR
ncbi:hypothetical protein OEM_14110 [Mycobacterium intracellulare subsp. yongonense 05-1390]|nr:hypothetical protein OEM_14110 [Mycobacterium intracellulare subsp. yongonense 05-1390]